MNCEQAGQKMLELMDGGAADPLMGETLAHCEQCGNCRAAYRALLILAAGLKRLPVQKPGTAFKAGLMSKLEPLTAKPAKVSEVLLACALLTGPALAASAWQFVATGSLGPSILSRVEELTALTASSPVVDSLRVSLCAANGYSAHTQLMTYSLAVITLALLGRLKPHRIRR